MTSPENDNDSYTIQLKRAFLKVYTGDQFSELTFSSCFFGIPVHRDKPSAWLFYVISFTFILTPTASIVKIPEFLVCAAHRLLEVSVLKQLATGNEAFAKFLSFCSGCFRKIYGVVRLVTSPIETAKAAWALHPMFGVLSIVLSSIIWSVFGFLLGPAVFAILKALTPGVLGAIGKLILPILPKTISAVITSVSMTTGFSATTTFLGLVTSALGVFALVSELFLNIPYIIGVSSEESAKPTEKTNKNKPVGYTEKTNKNKPVGYNDLFDRNFNYDWVEKKPGNKKGKSPSNVGKGRINGDDNNTSEDSIDDDVNSNHFQGDFPAEPEKKKKMNPFAVGRGKADESSEDYNNVFVDSGNEEQNTDKIMWSRKKELCTLTHVCAKREEGQPNFIQLLSAADEENQKKLNKKTTNQVTPGTQPNPNSWGKNHSAFSNTNKRKRAGHKTHEGDQRQMEQRSNSTTPGYQHQ